MRGGNQATLFLSSGYATTEKQANAAREGEVSGIHCGESRKGGNKTSSIDSKNVRRGAQGVKAQS